MYKQALLILSVLCLVSCTHELPLSVFEVQKLKLYVYSKDGGVTCSLERGSPQYERLRRWVEQNREGWKPSPATYIPGKVVSGDGFGLNFLNNFAVFNYAGGQYTHTAPPEEHQFLSCN